MYVVHKALFFCTIIQTVKEENMKFDPIVKVQQNRLFKISDGAEIPLENPVVVSGAECSAAAVPAKDAFCLVTVAWRDVEFSEGGYNEEYLAALREFLKKCEESGAFCAVVPAVAKALEDADEAESFIAAMVHAARRIKDCTSVLGFAIAPELLAKDTDFGANSYTQWFINEMNVKHSHYVYFAQKNAVAATGVPLSSAATELVLY